MSFNGYAQECITINELGNYLSKNLKGRSIKYDSVKLTTFVKFKVNASGTLDSIWVNDWQVKKVDYDKYLPAESAEGLRMIFDLYQKADSIRTEIFEILQSDNFCISLDERFDGFYLMPVVCDFRSNRNNYSYDNSFKALENLFEEGRKEYFFLSPIRVKKTCKGCL